MNAITRILYRVLWAFYTPLYDAICHLAPYRAMLRQIAEEARVESGMVILDVGCGTGNAASALRKEALARGADAEYHGLDASSAMLARAARKCGSWLNLKQGSLEGHLPYDDNTFDVVVASNVLYLLRDPQQAVAEIFRVLRPGGRFILTTPRNNPDIGAILNAHRRERGFWSLTWHIPALALVALLNLVIVRNNDYHFYDQEVLCELVGADYAVTAYADQVWLTSAQKLGDVEVRLARTDTERRAAHALAQQMYRDRKGYVSELGALGPTSLVFVAVHFGQVIGTVSILLGSEGMLPTEQYFGLKLRLMWPYLRPEQIMEIGRLAIFHRNREIRHRAKLGLIAAMQRWGDDHGVKIAIASLKPELMQDLDADGIVSTVIAGPEQLDREYVEEEYHPYFFPEKGMGTPPVAVAMELDRVRRPILVDHRIVRTGRVALQLGPATRPLPVSLVQPPALTEAPHTAA